MLLVNKACCSIPPIKSDYTPQGAFEEIGGLKCYAVGPKDAKKVLIGVYDIFGYFPQTQQGADLLATQGYRVVMPDFFRGNPFPNDAFPAYSSPLKAFASVSDETKSELMAFITGIAHFEVRQPELQAIASALRAAGAEKVGAYGLCWGGKLIILSACANTFDAIVQIHPARMEPADAETLTVPIASYISDDEPADAQEKLMEIVSNKPFSELNDFHHFVGMHHGWAGSRADLNDPVVAKNYQDVYNRLASFFRRALGN